MLYLSPQRKVLSCSWTLLCKMCDILLRADIDAVRIVPTWIILMSEVENLAPRLLIYRLIYEVRKLSHALLTTKQHFHTLMSYLLVEDGSLSLVGISTVRQINMHRVSSWVIPSGSTILHITQISIRNLIHRSVNRSLSTTQFVGSVHHPVTHLFLLVSIPVILKDRVAKSSQHISAG